MHVDADASLPRQPKEGQLAGQEHHDTHAVTHLQVVCSRLCGLFGLSPQVCRRLSPTGRGLLCAAA